MQEVQRKIGFWPVFSLVLGSQIGSSVLMSPANLAAYGWKSIWGYGVAGAGAIALALVFAGLCSRVPKTGGPHAYVEATFGRTMAFFVGWTYWVISWISTTTVIVASIGYLTPLIGQRSAPVYIFLEILLLGLITILNLRGIQTAGRAEFLLSVLKFIPLVVIPAIALKSFDANNFALAEVVAQKGSFASVLGHVTLLAFWGFVGIESATTPAGSVKNPKKTIPRAIILGTSCVAILYLFNGLSIMGALPFETLAASSSPYADVTQKALGGNWYLLISLIASVVCVGTLNSWVLVSGQIALGIAQDGLMPRFFGKTNARGAPVNSILVSSLGTVPFILLTGSDSLAQQVELIVDVSTMAFIFVYGLCALGFIKLLLREKCLNVFSYLAAFVGLAFCAWVVYVNPLHTLLEALGFVASALPLYFLWGRKHIERR